MRLAAIFVATWMLVVGAQRQASAVDYYCPEGYYGFMNGYYMYYTHYCDAGVCYSTGVAVSTMYTCGGDFPCCNPAATGCTDPIPSGAVHYVGTAAAKTDARKTAGGDKKAATAKKTGAAAASIPMLIGEVPQRNYLSASEKFMLPGDHVTKTPDIFVKIAEPDGSTSYFRIFSLTYVGQKPENQGTVHVGMEMDPDNPPATTNSGATRKKKGAGAVYKHTITYMNQDYDVCSVRELPNTP